MTPLAPAKRLLIVLLGCVLASAGEAAEVATTTALTVEEATADAVNWGLALSPSGRYLASLRKEGEQNQITVTDLQATSARPTLYAIPHGTVAWVAWDTDERLIAAAQFWADFDGKVVPLDRVDRRLMVPVKRLVAMDRDGKNFAMLLASKWEEVYTGDLAQVTDFLPDDPRHITMPVWQDGRLDLYRVETYTGGSELIAKGKTDTVLWFTDKDGYPAFRIDIGPWSSAALIYARKGPGNVDAAKLQWQHVYTVSLRDERDSDSAPDFYPLYPGPEKDSYYVFARPNGADTTGLYLYDFGAGKYLKTLATEAGIDIQNAYVDPDSFEFLGFTFHGDRKITRLTDPLRQAHLDALARHFADVDVYVQQVDRKRETWLLYTLGPRDRGTWHIYRPKEKSLRPIGSRYADIDAKRFGSTKVLRYRARDGIEIMGYLTRPPGASDESRPPLIMLPHGGPELRDYWDFDATVQLLASRGYQVFQPNFRGSSGFGKKFTDAGNRQWGAAMQNDLSDGLAYLVKAGYATHHRACIVGASYGGYAALAAATLTPDEFRCAASIAGVSDLPLQLEAFEDRLRRDSETWSHVKSQIGDPDDDEGMLEARSPARLAGAVNIPILLIHGEDDSQVPVEHSKKMDKALRKAGKNVRFVKLPKVGHWLGNEDWRKVYPPLLEFLDQHLPVVEPTPPPQPGS